MLEYRITKYDPKHRNAKGHYLLDEWTCFSEVGKNVTLGEYELVESAYIDTAMIFANSWDGAAIHVTSLEDYNDVSKVDNNQELSIDEVAEVVRSILRCEYWCKIACPNGFLHFGYDYYMFAGTANSVDDHFSTIASSGLFVEPVKSPHHNPLG